MAALTHDCPHCGTKSTFFPIHAAAVNPRVRFDWSALATCAICSGPLAIRVNSHGASDPSQGPHTLNATPNFEIIAIYPSNVKTEVPEHLHSEVAGPFMQAVEARQREHYDAAGAMYRKALDVALKKIDPQLKGNLASRIEKLAANNLLTPSLKEWAHTVRIDGNDATHDEDPFKKEEADQLHFFTQLVLTYLFTLPEQVKQRRAMKTS